MISLRKLLLNYHKTSYFASSLSAACKLNSVKERIAKMPKRKLYPICSEVLIAVLNYPQMKDTFFFFVCKLASDYKSVNFGMGDSSIIKCMANVCGRDEKFIKEDINKIGDLGSVVSESKSKMCTISSFFGKK